jgi:lysophospholipase L1-like esterase
MRRYLIVSLTSLLSILLALELLLRAFDPLGVVYFDRIRQMQRAFVIHPERGYIVAPGIYDFDDWLAAVNTDYERVTPDSVAGGCRVVFLGDSVTFGWGVDDGETFANLLAHELGLEAVNTGVSAYNAENIIATLDAYAADLYVWLIVGNDAEPERDVVEHSLTLRGRRSGWLGRYVSYLTYNPEAVSDWAAFNARLAPLLNRDDVLLFALDRPFADALTDVARVNYTGRISAADPHPNAAGHEEIAAAMLPGVRAGCDSP